MTIPTKFRKDREKAIASYNYIDIAGGTGITSFYAGLASGAFLLSTNKFYGQPYESTYSTTSAYPIIADWVAFNADFNLTQTIKGNTIVTVPLEVAGGGANTASANAHIYFYKKSGGITTFLASGATGIVASTGTLERASTGYIDFPLTIFKKGDTLTMSGAFLIGQAGGTGNFAFAYDPKNRAGSTITTIDTNLVIDLPFRIDL